MSEKGNDAECRKFKSKSKTEVVRVTLENDLHQLTVRT